MDSHLLAAKWILLAAEWILLTFKLSVSSFAGNIELKCFVSSIASHSAIEHFLSLAGFSIIIIIISNGDLLWIKITLWNYDYLYVFHLVLSVGVTDHAFYFRYYYVVLENLFIIINFISLTIIHTHALLLKYSERPDPAPFSNPVGCLVAVPQN